ncbi:putative high-affinity glucose transporter of the major facilitator superfamily [Fennellomyces sp. T-0311]|nr:putative high-affinity glucose transporter of the major facilitator superfamily [Fennellomyces sp. T-0311]
MPLPNIYELESKIADAGHYKGKNKQSGIRGIVKNGYAFATALFASIGGVLFGYDQGVISGVQEMKTFRERFPMTPTENGFMVAILELGAWVGSLSSGYFADKYSRKYAIVVFCIVFLVGGAVQGAARSLDYLFAGRFVTGMGVGGLGMIVPVYNAEIAPPEIRGSLVSLQQQAITFGQLLSFWLNYGTAHINSEAQWRIPLYFQMVLGLVLGLGILGFPFSPRWLISQGREEEALYVLSRLRRRPTHNVQEEWEDIKLATKDVHARYERQGYIGSWINLFTDLNILKRLLIACLLQFFIQFIGINAIIYYAPKMFVMFNLVDGSSDTSVLLATGVIGIVHFCATTLGVLFVDKIGRRPLLMLGSFNITLSLVVIAVILGTHGQGWVAAAFVYYFMASFGYSWGPMGYVYPSEIFPLHVRAQAVAVVSSAHWMCNFVIGLVTPPMLSTLGYRSYIFFAAWAFLSFFFACYIPETKGCSLEEMDEVFGSTRSEQDTLPSH